MLPGDPRQLANATPVGRVGRPEEVADLALAILRNGYVNSQAWREVNEMPERELMRDGRWLV